MILLSNKKCAAYKFEDLLFLSFLLIIRHFLVKRFIPQQFVELVKMSKFTTPTRIVVMNCSLYHQRI